MTLDQAYVDVVNELHAPARKNYKRRPVVIRDINETFQADLVDMQAYPDKGHKYILTVIDNFSKYAWARPLKSKTGPDVTAAMEDIFKEGRVCKKLHVDQGTEFYNADFKAMLRKYNVEMYSTFSFLKAMIVERFNRTIKTMMWKKFSLNGNYKWLGILPDLVSKYNNTVHSKIKMKPIDVNEDNAESLKLRVYNNYDVSDRAGKFKLGDRVRISKSKTIFTKGYLPSWSSELFSIAKVKKTKPVTYELKDYRDQPIEGCFYAEELQKTKHPDVYIIEKILRKRGSKVYVKWLGFDSSHNSWVSKKDL